MKKFQGEINGKKYTDQKEFEKDYLELLENGYTGDTLSVRYEVTETTDSVEQNKEERPGTKEKKERGRTATFVPEQQNADTRAKEIEEQLTDQERQTLCGSIDVIRSLVEESSKKIEDTMNLEKLPWNAASDLNSFLEASIQKIRWTVQRLPRNLRFLLCHSVYSATADMVDKVNSELVDRSYEAAKQRNLSSDEADEIKKRVTEIEQQMEDLQKEKEKEYERLNQLDDEYSQYDQQVIINSHSTEFFKNLLEVFEL